MPSILHHDVVTLTISCTRLVVCHRPIHRWTGILFSPQSLLFGLPSNAPACRDDERCARYEKTLIELPSTRRHYEIFLGGNVAAPAAYEYSAAHDEMSVEP